MDSGPKGRIDLDPPSSVLPVAMLVLGIAVDAYLLFVLSIVRQRR
jgi:hypothetical protein